MSKTKEPDTFTPREISIALNNTLLMCLRSSDGPVDEKRAQRLHDYARAIIEPALEHVEEGLLTLPELVAVGIGMALFVHTSQIVGAERLPATKFSKNLLGGKK